MADSIETAESAQADPIRLARDSFMAAINEATGGAAFVIQVGANDGRMADPVFTIAKRNAWRGLLIEPHPAYFAALHERYRRRTEFQLLQAGISDVDGVLPLYHLDNALMEAFPRWVHGSASVYRKRVVRQVRLACRKKGEEFADSMVVCTDVPMQRLDSVLAQRGIAGADLIVIDVEGHELAVMASVDLRSLGLRGMLVECNGSNKSQMPDYVAALNAAGLTVFLLGDDLCAFDPLRLTVDLAAQFRLAGLPHLGT